MYQKCPKCGYEREPADTTDEGTCPSCGLIFEKYLKSRFSQPGSKRTTRLRDRLRGKSRTSPWQALLQRALAFPTPVNPVIFYSHALVYAGLFIWGWNFILMDYYHMQGPYRIDHVAPEIGSSFMHNINLVFHEAGHVIFTPLGRFMQVLGGSLLQVLVPLIVCGAFLWKEQNPFGASVGLWWTGQSLMDVAPYINDARNGQIMLLGGTTGAETTGYHDWETLLTMMNMMEKDHAIAGFVDGLGVLVMLTAFLWGGELLRRQFKVLS